MTDKSLAEALRERAQWLHNKTGSCLEYGWGDKKNVVAALYEFADVVDSWSGEYISKEETEEIYNRRRWGSNSDPDAKYPTIEERRQIAADRRASLFEVDNSCKES